MSATLVFLIPLSLLAGWFARKFWEDTAGPDLRDWQRKVGEWSVGTFPRGTPHSQLVHLDREVDELGRANADPKTDLDEVAEEAADCFLLILGYAHRKGFNLERAAVRKFLENVNREWGEPDEYGVSEHIK